MPAERPAPEQSSVIEFLRSLRYQAPDALHSIDGTFVGMGRKPLPEDERKRRRAATQNKYATGNGRLVHAEADKRYHQTEGGRKKRNEAVSRWYYRHKKQQ